MSPDKLFRQAAEAEDGMPVSAGVRMGHIGSMDSTKASHSLEHGMSFLRFRVVPADTHPEKERLGIALACCWIDGRSPADAETVARQELRKQQWEVLECEAGELVSDSDYGDDDKCRLYYEQALIDKEVYVFFTSPRHPVYWVTAAVYRETHVGVSEAHYFLCNSAIRQVGEDIYAPIFWSGQRERVAVDAARAAIQEQGWTAATILAQRPCGRGDVPDNLTSFYDKAEESGACLVIIRDESE